jgi:hypothetical protein
MLSQATVPRSVERGPVSLTDIGKAVVSRVLDGYQGHNGPGERDNIEMRKRVMGRNVLARARLTKQGAVQMQIRFSWLGSDW